LLQQPERWRALQADPTLVANTLEESLRYDAAVQGMIRTTTQEVQIADVTIPAGDRIMFFFSSANRDDTAFSDPEHFDLQRPNANKHLTLGYGIHYCIGAPLARLEARIAVETLMKRIPDLRLAPDYNAAFLPNLFNRTLQQLHVVWGDQ